MSKPLVLIEMYVMAVGRLTIEGPGIELHPGARRHPRASPQIRLRQEADAMARL